MTKFAYLIEPPFNYRDETGAVTGCDIEVARAVLRIIGHDDIEFVEAEFADLLPGLAAGRWDMTTGLFATPERRRIASFSRPIWALADGLLVAKGNPLALKGYRSVAENRACTLAVIRDQVQHHTAVLFGVPSERILVCDTYADAADAVVTGRASAYASVARAHLAFLGQRSGLPLDTLTIGPDEKEPAFGCFGFALGDAALRRDFDGALASYLGSKAHRATMRTFGFVDADVDLVATRSPMAR